AAQRGRSAVFSGARPKRTLSRSSPPHGAASLENMDAWEEDIGLATPAHQHVGGGRDGIVVVQGETVARFMTNDRTRVAADVILEQAVAGRAERGPRFGVVWPGLQIHLTHEENIELNAGIAMPCNRIKLGI